MTAADCIAALEDARDALDRHYRAYDKAHNGAHNPLGIEARKRVNQMAWLLVEIGRYLSLSEASQQAQRELGALLESGKITAEEWSERLASSEMTDRHRTLVNIHRPLETLTEAFYWIAGRARTVIRALPNMETFEAAGVRNTRNKLLEHPEKGDSGVLLTSFGWGAEIGPVVKALRYENQAEVWPDRGLFINSTEFATELRTKADQAVAAIATN